MILHKLRVFDATSNVDTNLIFGIQPVPTSVKQCVLTLVVHFAHLVLGDELIHHGGTEVAPANTPPGCEIIIRTHDRSLSDIHVVDCWSAKNLESTINVVAVAVHLLAAVVALVAVVVIVVHPYPSFLWFSTSWDSPSTSLTCWLLSQPTQVLRVLM